MTVPSGETEVKMSFSCVPRIPESLKVIKLKSNSNQALKLSLFVGEENVRHPKLFPEIIFSSDWTSSVRRNFPEY